MVDGRDDGAVDYGFAQLTVAGRGERRSRGRGGRLKSPRFASIRRIGEEQSPQRPEAKAKEEAEGPGGFASTNSRREP